MGRAFANHYIDPDTGRRIKADACELRFLPLDARIVPGYPDYYVTPRGEIFSARKHSLRLLTHKPQVDGYMRYHLYSGPGESQWHLAHRIIAQVFIGPAPDAEAVVHHIDGVRNHNDVSNLMWMSQRENSHPARRLNYTHNFDFETVPTYAELEVLGLV